MYEYEKIGGYMQSLSEDFLDKLDRIEKLREKLHINVNDLQKAIKNDIYESVSIEGNSLSRKEVTYYLENSVTVRGKPLRDYVQVSNCESVLSSLKNWLLSADQPLSEDLILTLHNTVTKGELPAAESGQYRDAPVYIKTSVLYTPPDSEFVPYLMQELIENYNAPLRLGESRFERICELKRNFERIHPFFDGNGRTGRLLMNIMFLQHGYGYVSIPSAERDTYFSSIENNTFHEFAADKMLECLKQIDLEKRRENELER